MIALVAALFLAQDPALRLDFAEHPQGVRLSDGVRTGPAGLEFLTALQTAETDLPGRLDGIEAATIGGWFFPKRAGEQVFFSRGLPECGPNGERMFPAKGGWVNFLIGTDAHGFFMGTLHGNGSMPFPFVTLNEVPINTWSQLVVVKDARGYQKFYRNGVLVATDLEAAAAGVVRPFRDREAGEPVRVAMPLGGTVGEAWVYPRELSEEEIRRDYESKKGRYAPSPPAAPVLLRDIDPRPPSDLRPFDRERIEAGLREIFGPMPVEKVPLEPRMISEEDCGRYVRRKVSLQVQPGDRMPAYLLIPKERKGRVPAIICFYGTTGGAGKETTVGLSGPRPGTPPAKNRAFAVDMVEAGFVAFAADYLRDGERITPGKRPYDSTEFYEKFPDWSIHGKDAWDTMRAIDYLQSLDVVDPERIGMVGHSYGGHSTIFTAAMEPRIQAAWANGPVSDFVHHGMHWASPKGAGSSQSLPALRPYLLEKRPPPLTFYDVTSLIAPRALAVGQAVGERRPMEEENCAAVTKVYRDLGAADRVRYVWYPGDHDFPPHVRREAVAWFRKWLASSDRVAVVTPDAKSPAVRSLKHLWKDRATVAPAAEGTGALAVVLDGPLPAPGAFRAVVCDLALFPGARITPLTLENPNRLPIDPFDIRTIEEAGRDYAQYLQRKGTPSEKTLAIRDGLKAEIAEPIPSIRIVEADPALRGFAPGDVLPWCGQKKGVYRQRTGTFPADVRVLAVSTLNGEAVLVRKGDLYGIDLDLEEPTLEWDNRGAFHKWIPVSNLGGPGVRAGRYWPKKPTYAEFAREVRAFAERHPEWALEAVGRRGDDEIHCLTLGDPKKELYVFIGMPHAEDEWMPALGSLSFAELLSRLREEPEVKARLQRFSVKIYPLIHPATYESPMAEPGAKRESDLLDLEKTRHDRAYSITQLHQGGDVLVTACGTPVELARRIAARAREDFSGRHVWWNHHHGKVGPQVWEEHAPTAPMPPSWSAYWWQGGRTSCYGLYPHDTVFAARAMWFVEQDFLLLMPHRFTQAGQHHALHRMFFEHASTASLLLTDQTANWCLSILLTDHAGQDRDASWRPDSGR